MVSFPSVMRTFRIGFGPPLVFCILTCVHPCSTPIVSEQYSVICFLAFRTSNSAILYAYSGNVGGIVVISRTLVCTVKRARNG